MNDQQTLLELQGWQDVSLVLPASAEPLNALPTESGLSSNCNPEVRSRVSHGSRSNIDAQNRHSVFVLSKEGLPLTPTTPAKARKLLRGGVAKPVWSKFNTFGIQMLVESGQRVSITTLGVDNGTKYEGYAVVCGTENVLSVKLDLPDKKQIVRKLQERRTLRRARRHRKTRCRPRRFDNRSRRGFIAPSQAVIVNSRLKVMRELFRMYPIRWVGFENVRFNHARKRWGANFSTVEIGKAKIKALCAEQGARIFELPGYETGELRQKYGYQKTSDKSADTFTAHCSDALALAVEAGPGRRVEPGRFVVVDDSYRPVRRRLHDTQAAKGGIRENYSRGTVQGYRKGVLIGTLTGKIGRLCGAYLGGFRFYDSAGKRQSAKRLA